MRAYCPLPVAGLVAQAAAKEDSRGKKMQTIAREFHSAKIPDGVLRGATIHSVINHEISTKWELYDQAIRHATVNLPNKQQLWFKVSFGSPVTPEQFLQVFGAFSRMHAWIARLRRFISLELKQAMAEHIQRDCDL